MAIRTINFLAESMQGYNNPKIEIVNVEVDKGAPITQITFNDIAKILARGVFPILSVWSVFKGNKTRHLLPLSYAQNDEILFSTIVVTGTPSSPSAEVYGFKFVTSEPPVLFYMPIKNTTT